LAAVTGVVGAQTALGGFLLAIIGGHEARFTQSFPDVGGRSNGVAKIV